MSRSDSDLVERVRAKIALRPGIERWQTDEGQRSLSDTGAPAQIGDWPSLSAVVIADHKGTGGPVWSMLLWDSDVRMPVRRYAMLDSAGMAIITYIDRPTTIMDPYHYNETSPHKGSISRIRGHRRAIESFRKIRGSDFLSGQDLILDPDIDWTGLTLSYWSADVPIYRRPDGGLIAVYHRRAGEQTVVSDTSEKARRMATEHVERDHQFEVWHDVIVPNGWAPKRIGWCRTLPEAVESLRWRTTSRRGVHVRCRLTGEVLYQKSVLA